jgi:hypothetical protein
MMPEIIEPVGAVTMRLVRTMTATCFPCTWIISRDRYRKGAVLLQHHGIRRTIVLLAATGLIAVGCSTPSSASLSLDRYTGTWYDPIQGVMLVVKPDGRATLLANGSSCGKPGGKSTCTDSWSIKFAGKPDTAGLHGTITSNGGPYMNNEVGSPVVLNLTPKNGLITMNSPIGDGAGFCQKAEIKKCDDLPAA